MSEAKHLRPSNDPATVRAKQKRRKILFLLLRFIAAVLITGSVAAVYYYSTRPIEIYGQKINVDAREIDLTGADIASVGELLDNLAPFTKLEKLELGEYPVLADEEQKLINGLYGVRIHYKCYVPIYGELVPRMAADLDLSGKDIGDVTELSAALKKLPNIREVNLHGKSLTFEEQTALVNEFPEVKFGWEIELLGQSYSSDITDLDLSGNKRATPDLMRQYVPLFTKLERLDMSDCGATNEEMDALRSDLPGVKVVWRIHMGRWSLKTDAVAFSVLIYDYSHTRLTSKDIEVLKYCTDLQALDIGHQAVTDISVLGDYLPQLRILILADNQVSDLTPVAKMKHLHYIELFVNSHLLKDLSPLASCKELVDANVSYLHNVRDISPLYDLPMLERIWIEHTPIPADQLNTLRERHPDAKIVVEGKGSVDQGWRTHERYFAMIGMFHDKNCTELSESFSKYDK